VFRVKGILEFAFGDTHLCPYGLRSTPALRVFVKNNYYALSNAARKGVRCCVR
jgi:hypothetical protein